MMSSEERSIKRKIWRTLNRDKENLYKKRYYDKNTKVVLEQNKKHYEKYKDVQIEKNKEYYHKNKKPLTTQERERRRLDGKRWKEINKKYLAYQYTQQNRTGVWIPIAIVRKHYKELKKIEVK